MQAFLRACATQQVATMRSYLCMCTCSFRISLRSSQFDGNINDNLRQWRPSRSIILLPSCSTSCSSVCQHVAVVLSSMWKNILTCQDVFGHVSESHHVHPQNMLEFGNQRHCEQLGLSNTFSVTDMLDCRPHLLRYWAVSRLACTHKYLALLWARSTLGKRAPSCRLSTRTLDPMRRGRQSARSARATSSG